MLTLVCQGAHNAAIATGAKEESVLGEHTCNGHAPVARDADIAWHQATTRCGEDGHPYKITCAGIMTRVC